MEQKSVNQPVRGIDLPNDGGRVRCYMVGHGGVSRIEMISKPGLHSDIPYVRVWKGDLCEGEFCQHNIVGVYFGDPEPEFDEVYASCGHPVGAAECSTCMPF